MNIAASDTIYSMVNEMKTEVLHIYFDVQYQLRRAISLLTELRGLSVGNALTGLKKKTKSNRDGEKGGSQNNGTNKK